MLPDAGSGLSLIGVRFRQKVMMSDVSSCLWLLDVGGVPAWSGDVPRDAGCSLDPDECGGVSMVWSGTDALVLALRELRVDAILK